MTPAERTTRKSMPPARNVPTLIAPSWRVSLPEYIFPSSTIVAQVARAQPASAEAASIIGTPTTEPTAVAVKTAPAIPSPTASS